MWDITSLSEVVSRSPYSQSKLKCFISFDPAVIFQEGREKRMENGRAQFPFPYQPYDIQEQFMQALYSALDQGKVGIFESPTGTVCVCVNA